MTIHPVILCGGPGSRLWPASTPDRPKPFLDLIGGPSLFQRTALRLAAMEGAAAPIVVTGLAHLELVRQQLHEIGCRGTILAEPEGRDSAPAIIAAALLIARDNPEDLAIVVASDHHIPDTTAFAEGVAIGVPAARAGKIVTFGVAPTAPSTAYGYIRPGAAIGAGSPVLKVDSFLEKPDQARARALIEAGCLWNSGNFLFRADVMLEETEAHAPGLVGAVAAALGETGAGEEVRILGPAFRSARKVSIDIAVMEKTSHAVVTPVRYEWSDLGSWDAIWTAAAQDERGNAAMGRAVVEGSENCLVRADPGMEIVTVGMKKVAVVAAEGRVLVCDLDHAAGIKTAVQRLAAPADVVEAGGAELSGAGERLRHWLWNRVLPTWWCFGADHAAGGFREQLRWDLSATGHPRRLRVQARQVFVYATAGRMGWPGPWQAAVQHGLDFLESHYRRSDRLYRTRLSAEQTAADDSANLYDQAFVLLALAAAAQAEPERAAVLSLRAGELVQRLRETFGIPGGGFRAREGEDAFEADPVMHLFEAAQAWLDAGDAPLWRSLAAELADHALHRMIDRPFALIRETFDADWRPAEGRAGRLIEPGHQFEWAWLLERWGRRSGDAQARTVAQALYAAGRRGVEPDTGLVLDELLDDFTPTGATCRLWPQAERLRAALLMETDPSSRIRAGLSAAAAMEGYFTKDPVGLWRDARPDRPGPPRRLRWQAPSITWSAPSWRCRRSPARITRRWWKPLRPSRPANP